MPFFSSARWRGIPSLGPTQLGVSESRGFDARQPGYGNDPYLDTYSNIPAATTHSRSTTSRGDPQQEHDQRRFRADHEAVEQAAPAGFRAPSDDGKFIVAPFVRPTHWLIYAQIKTPLPAAAKKNGPAVLFVP